MSVSLPVFQPVSPPEDPPPPSHLVGPGGAPSVLKPAPTPAGGGDGSPALKPTTSFARLLTLGGRLTPAASKSGAPSPDVSPTRATGPSRRSTGPPSSSRSVRA